MKPCCSMRSPRGVSTARNPRSTFTYAFRQAGQWQYFTATAMTREQADEAFRAKHPRITEYKVKSTPAVEVGMRGFYGLKSTVLRQYFIDCGIDPETMTGEATFAHGIRRG